MITLYLPNDVKINGNIIYGLIINFIKIITISNYTFNDKSLFGDAKFFILIVELLYDNIKSLNANINSIS